MALTDQYSYTHSDQIIDHDEYLEEDVPLFIEELSSPHKVVRRLRLMIEQKEAV